jgi:hypothetical protein
MGVFLFVLMICIDESGEIFKVQNYCRKDSSFSTIIDFSQHEIEPVN